MVTFFTSSFRKARGSSPESLAIKNANLFLQKKRAENDAGVINDPAAYTEAIEKFLRPYEDDVTVATKIASLQAESNQLADKVNNEELKKTVLNSDLEDALFEIGRNNYSDPGTVILKTAAVYDQYLNELDAEIDSRRENNQSYASLLELKRQIEPKVKDLASLTRSYMAGENRMGDNTAPRGNFGFFVKTNPETGKILNFSLQPIDTSDPKVKGYLKTDSFYGTVPVYLNGTRDPKQGNAFVGKLGDKTYKGESEQTDVPEKETPITSTVLKLQNKKNVDLSFGQSIANVFRVGQKQKNFDIEQGAYDVNLPQDAFDYAVNMPKNSIGRDSQGNYYYLNTEGKWFKSPNAKLLSEMTGLSESQVNSQSYFLSKPDLKAIGNFQEPNGQSRILNERNTFSPQILNGGMNTTTPSSTPPQPVSVVQPAENPGQSTTAGTNVDASLARGSAVNRAMQNAKGAELQKKNTERISMANVLRTNA